MGTEGWSKEVVSRDGGEVEQGRGGGGERGAGEGGLGEGSAREWKGKGGEVRRS